MEQYVRSLISRYRSAGVLVDSNLLLLLYVGGYDRELVATFRRTRDRFRPSDFDALRSALGDFEAIVTTPHILTEVSNLMGQLTGPARDECFDRFAKSIPVLNEHRPPSAHLVSDAAFVTLGITDTSILEIAARRYLVFTDDFPLYNRLTSRGIDTLNYNHIRPL
jgi:rRNA-processing protein FCF1